MSNRNLRLSVSLTILTIICLVWLGALGVWPLFSLDLIDYCQHFHCSRYLVEPTGQMQNELDSSSTLEEAMTILDYLLQLTKLQTFEAAWQNVYASLAVLSLLWTSYRHRFRLAWWAMLGLVAAVSYHQVFYLRQLTHHAWPGYYAGSLGTVAVLALLLNYEQAWLKPK